MTTDQSSQGAGPSDADDRIRTTFQAQLRAEQARLANGMVGQGAGASEPSGRPGRGRLGLVAVAVVAIAAIAGGLLLDRSDEVRRVETADDQATTPTDDRVTTTTSSTPPTTGPTSTADRPSTTGTASTNTPGPTADLGSVSGFNRTTGYAVAVVEDGTGATRFVAFDLATGEEVATFASQFLEASWYSPLQLTPTGDAAYLTQSSEDFWYSCDGYLPDLIRVELDPAASTAEPPNPVGVGQGVEPRMSPGGTRLAYLTASDCVPDPEQPGQWVVAPLDTIVVRDLASGQERRWTAPGIVAAVTEGGDYRGIELAGLVWLGDDRLATSGGEILSAADLVPTGDRLRSVLDREAFDRVLGYDQIAAAVVLERVRSDGDGRTAVEVVAIEVATGRETVLWSLDDAGAPVTPAGLDSTGRNLIAAQDEGLVLPDGSVVAIGSSVLSVDW